MKSLGLASQEVARLNSTTNKILALELKKVRYLRSLSFVQGTAVNFLRTSIMFLMLYLIYERQITVGQFFSLFIYSFFIFGPLQELGNVINAYRETEASLANFQTILDTPREPRPANPTRLERLRDLAFEDVGFTHLTANAPAVSDITFSATRGQTLAFVGPSGAGKTTLVKLLVGLYRPASGAIRYNGHPHDGVDMDALRERIGFVTQDTQLFSGHHPREPAVRESRGDRRAVPGRAAQGGLPAAAGARGSRSRHGHRRGRRQGVGRREAAPVDRPRAAAAAPTSSSSTKRPRRSTR